MKMETKIIMKMKLRRNEVPGGGDELLLPYAFLSRGIGVGIFREIISIFIT
jgi:hypothetical protein